MFVYGGCVGSAAVNSRGVRLTCTGRGEKGRGRAVGKQMQARSCTEVRFNDRGRGETVRVGNRDVEERSKHTMRGVQ